MTPLPTPSRNSTPSSASAQSMTNRATTLGSASRSGALSAAIASLKVSSAGKLPKPPAIRTSTSPITSGTAEPPLSSRSTGMSIGGGDMVNTPQPLFHLQGGEAGEYCFGMMGTGKTRVKVCCKKRVECTVAGHLSPKVTLLEDSLYIKSRGQSVLLWPFVRQADLATAGESLSEHLSARRSTSGHMECFHQFYERNKALLKAVLSLPRVSSMIGPSASSTLKSSSSVASGASGGSGVLVSRAMASSRGLSGPFHDASSIHSRTSIALGLSNDLEQEADRKPPATQISFKVDPADYNSLSGLLVNSEDDWMKDAVAFEDIHFDGDIPSGEFFNSEGGFGDNPVGAYALGEAFELLIKRVNSLAALVMDSLRKDKTDITAVHQELCRLHSASKLLFDFVNGSTSVESTYEAHGAVWDGLLEAINSLTILKVSLSDSKQLIDDAMDMATRSREQAASVDAALSAEMNSVAEGFLAISTSLDELRAFQSSTPPVSRLGASLAQRASSLIQPAALLGASNVGGGSASVPAGTIPVSTAPVSIPDEILARFDSLEATVRLQGSTIEALQTENGELRTLLSSSVPSADSDGAAFDVGTIHLRKYFNMDEDTLSQFLISHWSKTSSVDRVAIFTDMVSIMSHMIDGTSNRTVQDHAERTKLMVQCGLVDPPCQRSVFSFEQQFPIGVATNKGGDVKPTETFPMLSSKNEWIGESGQAGSKALFLDKVDSASKMANDYILRHTAAGPLRELCLELKRISTLFWTDLFAYLNDDLERLIQFKIPEQQCLVLISSQLKIILKAVFDSRKFMPQLSSTVTMDYTAQFAFYTLQAHQVMTDFSSKKFTGHGLLGNCFIRFLAAQVGETSAPAMTKKIKTLEERVDKEVKKMNQTLDATLKAVKNEKSKGSTQ